MSEEQKKRGRPKKNSNAKSTKGSNIKATIGKLILTNNSTSVFCVPLELSMHNVNIDETDPKKITEFLMKSSGKPRKILKPGESAEINEEAFNKIKNNNLWRKLLEKGAYSVSKKAVKSYAEDRQVLSEPEVPSELKNDDDSAKLGMNVGDVLT